MTRLEPFAGLRYNPQAVDLDRVTAPPYDVISETDRDVLEARSPYNAVRVELARDGADHDRYESARRTFEEWTAMGILVADESRSFYGYGMRFEDEAGEARRTLGVIGALGLDPDGEGSVLPHERTMPKPKGDRLNLLRACRANLSPIWGLSTVDGLAELCAVDRAPDAACLDEAGTRHELWRLDDREQISAIRAAVSKAPVIIADGHHRYETALAYQAEVRAAGGGEGDHDFLMALVVELVDEQLSVRAIHRLVTGLPEGFDICDALRPFFAFEGPIDVGPHLTAEMLARGRLVLVTPGEAWYLSPLPALDAAEADLDSSRLDVALTGLPPHELSFQHGWQHVVAAVGEGRAQAGVLLRPARVDQIADTSRSGVRMPEKTTFFYPKPRTGLVFRRLAPPNLRQ